MEKFADGFVIEGWTKVNGVWYTIGSVPSVTTDGIETPPQLTPEMVADKLNELETSRI